MNTEVKRPEPELPYPWYERNGQQYPIPVDEDGWTNQNPDFLAGWEKGVTGENASWASVNEVGTSLFLNRYFDGYVKGIYWAAANGVIDSFHATEMFKQIPPAVPAKSDPILPTAVEVKLPPLPIGKTAIWLEGWQDAFDLKEMKKFDPNYSHGTAAEYREGYHSGMEWMVDEGRITQEVAMAYLGLTMPTPAQVEFLHGVATAFGEVLQAKAEPKRLDVFISEIEAPDMVTNPPHYTFGKYEVIDVLMDWQLPYPLDNVVKYAARAGKKGGVEKELEDLEKARFYLNYRIAELGGEDWNPKNR